MEPLRQHLQSIFVAFLLTLVVTVIVNTVYGVLNPGNTDRLFGLSRRLKHPMPVGIPIAALLLAAIAAAFVAAPIESLGLFVVSGAALVVSWNGPLLLQKESMDQDIVSTSQRHESVLQELEAERSEREWLENQAKLRAAMAGATAALFVKRSQDTNEQAEPSSKPHDRQDESKQLFRACIANGVSLLGANDRYEAVVYMPDSSKEYLEPWIWTKGVSPTKFLISPPSAHTGKARPAKRTKGLINGSRQTGLAPATWRDGQPRFVRFTQANGRWIPESAEYAKEYLPTKNGNGVPGFQALALLPIALPEGERLGVLCVSARRPDSFDATGLQHYLGSFARELAFDLTLLRS